MNKAKTLTEEERETSGGTLAVILLCIVIVWAASGWLLHPMKERGTFGDMFGAVNALFSGLAFATLIFTVFLQRRELQLQRKELEYTRQEIRRSAAAQEASEAALRAQAEASERTAKLAAINNLLPIYQQKLERITKHSLQVGEPWKSEYKVLKEREGQLTAILDFVYHQITTEHAQESQTNSGISTDHPSPEN